MCGIVGFIEGSSGGALRPVERVALMAREIEYRGPDDMGVWADEAWGVALGHCRLSIIDVTSAGHQPMISACGRFVISFNGEIYNHLDLRAVLELEGHAPKWRGHSDTETLLAAISAWGFLNTLERVVGMFAIALWDREERVLKLARDRLGEKPLYYGWVNDAFVFGSELKALRVYPGFRGVVDRNVLGLYMQFGVVPAPFSIYEGIKKLPPASILTLPVKPFAQPDPVIKPYWSFCVAAHQGLARPFSNEGEALRALESQLRESVSAQCVADVPLGAFLSGGVDSSLIAALMQEQSSRPIKTFTVSFAESGFDESPFARAVAAHLRTDHHEVRVGAADALAVIPALPTLYDEPFADSSQIASHLVCKSAVAQLKVALSGDGGDELFGGYNRYLWSRRGWQVWRHMPVWMRRAVVWALEGVSPTAYRHFGSTSSKGLGIAQLGVKAQKLANRIGAIHNIDDIYLSLITEWPPASGIVLGSRDIATLIARPSIVAGIDDIEHRMMMWDTLGYLPDDILTKVDRAAMSVSLETRVPFLDHRVVELAWRLPLSMKIRNNQGKWALRQILYKHVPPDLIERPKAGFAVPLGEWLRGPLRDWAESLLSAPRLSSEGYFDPKPIRLAWTQHLSGSHDWTQRLWYVLMFQAWLEKNA